MDNNLISHYQIIKNISTLTEENLYLVTCLDSHKNYYLQQFSFRDDSLLKEVEKIKKLMNSSEDNLLRFPHLKEVIKSEEYLAIVFEIIKGKSFFEQIQEHNLWGESEVIANLRHLLNTLNLFAQCQIIHQNLKPQQIVINEINQQPSLINYGKVDPSFADLMMTIAVEDRLYLAPEQISKKPVIATDIYALGMIIITIMTGKNIMDFTENEEGKIRWENDVNIAPNLVKIINKMIAIKLSDRYQNPSEVLADLNIFFPAENLDSEINRDYHYTPTEILTPTIADIETEEQEQEQEQEEIKTEESSLNPTAIVEENNRNYDDIDNQTEKEIDYSQSNLANTEFVTEEENIIENISNNNVENSPINLEINSEPKLVTETANQPSTNQQSNQSNQWNNFLANNHLALKILSLIKTPQGIIISLGFSLVIIFAGAMFKNYLSEQKIDKILAELSTYYQEDKYSDCIRVINSSEVQSLEVASTISKEFLGKCYLGLAELEARERNFVEAINIAVKIDSHSPVYERSQKFIDDWSKQILNQAKDIYDRTQNLELALEMLAEIPQSSSEKEKALDYAREWQQQGVDSGIVIELCPGPLCPSN